MFMLKRFALVLTLALLALTAIVTFNTLRLKAEPLASAPRPLPVDAPAVQRLSQAVRIPTISTEAGPAAPEIFATLHALLERNFPRVHSKLKREQVGGGSLLFTWRGSNPAAPALLLTAHQDVVPIDNGSESRWSHPPLGGAVADGFVWGRGTLDDKGSVMAILEAVERLLARGYRPRQTVYLAFGHDEEIGGTGAAAMSVLLKQRAANIGLALDEGSAVLDGVVPGVRPPVAMIGVASKGYVSVELSASGPGGHSSMPTNDNAAVRIARAVDRIAGAAMPVRVISATSGTLDAIAPYTKGAMRVALANRWLTQHYVKGRLLAQPTSAATLRTTTAPTILQAGTKDNVLPQRARAVINHRILPGDTIDSVIARDGAAVDDRRVALRALPGGFNPEQSVPTDSTEYRQLARAIRDTFPNAVVAPGLVVAATDLRHYQSVARSPLRFSPFTMTNHDLTRVHGNDERIGIADYMRAIRFYERLISAP